MKNWSSAAILCQNKSCSSFIWLLRKHNMRVEEDKVRIINEKKKRCCCPVFEFISDKKKCIAATIHKIFEANSSFHVK